MCDYSLEQYRTRPAVAGERYETHRFPTGTIGFVAPADTSVAVCMACDTQLKLTRIPEAVRATCGVSGDEDATFTRLDSGPYFDGVRFRNGAEVSLQRLGPGVIADVIDTLSERRWRREPADAA